MTSSNHYYYEAPAAAPESPNASPLPPGVSSYYGPQQPTTRSKSSVSVASDGSWRKPGKYFRSRLLLQDRQISSFQLNKECSIEKYYQVADRVLEQFLQHPIDDQEELIEAYLIGSRLSLFLTQTLPTHPDYFSTQRHLTLLRDESQKHMVDLVSYCDQIAKMIDRHEHSLYIQKVLEQDQDIPEPRRPEGLSAMEILVDNLGDMRNSSSDGSGVASQPLLRPSSLNQQFEETEDESNGQKDISATSSNHTEQAMAQEPQEWDSSWMQKTTDEWDSAWVQNQHVKTAWQETYSPQIAFEEGRHDEAKRDASVKQRQEPSPPREDDMPVVAPPTPPRPRVSPSHRVEKVSNDPPTPPARSASPQRLSPEVVAKSSSAPTRERTPPNASLEQPWDFVASNHSFDRSMQRMRVRQGSQGFSPQFERSPPRYADPAELDPFAYQGSVKPGFAPKPDESFDPFYGYLDDTLERRESVEAIFLDRSPRRGFPKLHPSRRDRANSIRRFRPSTPIDLDDTIEDRMSDDGLETAAFGIMEGKLDNDVREADLSKSRIEERLELARSEKQSKGGSPTGAADWNDAEDVEMLNAFLVKKRRPLSHFRSCVRCLLD